MLPYGEIVLRDNLSAMEEFSSEINRIIVSVQWNLTLPPLWLVFFTSILGWASLTSKLCSNRLSSVVLDRSATD